MKIVEPKFKQCKICNTSFQLFRSTQKVCSIKCAAEIGRQKEQKKADKLHSQKKRELKDNDRSFQLKKTQAIFNKFIRLRDQGHTCISCGRPPKKKNAGHYLSRGSHPELRFEELNCHLQCEHCNTFMSANQAKYRINLLTKIGSDKVDWIEGPHEPKKYTLDQLKELQQHYKKLIKGIEDVQCEG